MVIQPFEEPIYVSRPLLPKLDKFYDKLYEIWDEKWLTNNGRQLKLFEEKLLDYLRVPNISVFNNGTSALLAGVKVLELTGEVITTPFTFAATPHAIALNQLDTVFCDIDPVTMNIDPLKIEEAITPKTSAILAVHVFGTPCDVYRIQDIADKHNLKVIYDGAHAFGCEINGTSIGNFGDLTMFSFHATKLFHTSEGGALSYNDESLDERLSLFKNFGIANEEEVKLIGFNGKMNEIQAVMGQLVLDLVDEEQKRRAEIFELYQRNLASIEGITIMPQLQNVKNSYQYFVIRIDESKFKKK
ncbi:aminotransferase [Paenibacillus macerans]|nr:aminotransferase [Paenibacillus macerans]